MKKALSALVVLLLLVSATMFVMGITISVFVAARPSLPLTEPYVLGSLAFAAALVLITLIKLQKR